MNARIPPRRSGLDGWLKAVRERWPGAERVNLGVFIEALSTPDYFRFPEQFLCQEDGERALRTALKAVFLEGAQPVPYLGVLKPELDRAAGGCGVDAAKAFR